MTGKHCVICVATEGGLLHKCPNPRCINWICRRHGLLYEIHDEMGSRLDYYCSRQCWNSLRQHALPISKELIFFALVLFVALPLYLLVVSFFT
jgi:hypothetical protein